MAAASITLAIKIHFETKVRKTEHDLKYEIYDVMNMWTNDIEKATDLSVEIDLKPVYRLLKTKVK